jgi:hypothetical protein
MNVQSGADEGTAKLEKFGNATGRSALTYHSLAPERLGGFYQHLVT